MTGGYGASLLQALLALAAVSFIAWLALRAMARMAGRGRLPGHIQVLERTALDARRSLYLVRVGERAWLVGAGEGTAPRVLAELSRAELPSLAEHEGPR
jgi:flagellar biogenesis protein FliO